MSYSPNPTPTNSNNTWARFLCCCTKNQNKGTDEDAPLLLSDSSDNYQQILYLQPTEQQVLMPADFFQDSTNNNFPVNIQQSHIQMPQSFNQSMDPSMSTSGQTFFQYVIAPAEFGNYLQNGNQLVYNNQEAYNPISLDQTDNQIFQQVFIQDQSPMDTKMACGSDVNNMLPSTSSIDSNLDVITDDDGDDMNWLYDLLSDGAGALNGQYDWAEEKNGFSPMPDQEANLKRPNVAVSPRNSALASQSDDASSISTSDVSHSMTSDRRMSQAELQLLMSPDEAVPVGPKKRRKRRTVGEADTASELNARLVKSVATMKLFRQKIAIITTQFLPQILATYFNGVLDFSVISSFFHEDIRLTFPAQLSLARRAGLAEELGLGDRGDSFNGYDEVCGGSKAFRRILADLLTASLLQRRSAEAEAGPESFTHGRQEQIQAVLSQIALVVALTEGDEAVWSSMADRMSIRFNWQSLGLTNAAGFPSEMSVEGLFSCNLLQGRVSRGLIVLDSESVLRQLGLNFSELELEFLL